MLSLPMLLGVVPVAIALWHLVHHVFSPLRPIPGPFLARFTNAWYLWTVRNGEFERANKALHEQYGPVVRYGPNRFSFDDPAAMRVIYAHGTAFSKSPWYIAWAAPGETTLFSDRSIKRHAQQRKLFQNAYTMSSLITYEPYVNECADLFSQRLLELSQARLPVDMGHWFQCYAFDVICHITYGKRLGFLDQGQDIGGVIGALENFLTYATQVGIYSNLHAFIYSLKNYLAGAKGTARAYVISFTKDRLAEYQSEPKAVSAGKYDGSAGEPFLSKFFAKHDVDPVNFTSGHVAMGCIANMVAGSDTTAITLSAIIYHLLKEPQCLEALQQEIDQFSHDGKLSQSPTFQESQQMPYLQATIKEALRMHPATGLPLERVVPEGGATISGHFFPAGSIVGINSWVQHRNKLIYGPDADTFRPERWLTEDENKLSEMNRYWMPFGLGSRTCLGRHISILEISKLIPRIVRDFNFGLAGTVGQRGVQWSTSNYWFVKPKKFEVVITARNV